MPMVTETKQVAPLLYYRKIYRVHFNLNHDKKYHKKELETTTKMAAYVTSFSSMRD